MQREGRNLKKHNIAFWQVVSDIYIFFFNWKLHGWTLGQVDSTGWLVHRSLATTPPRLDDVSAHTSCVQALLRNWSRPQFTLSWHATFEMRSSTWTVWYAEISSTSGLFGHTVQSHQCEISDWGLSSHRVRQTTNSRQTLLEQNRTLKHFNRKHLWHEAAISKWHFLFLTFITITLC